MAAIQLEKEQVSHKSVMLKAVKRAFAGKTGEVVALDNITLETRSGETIAIVGPSGCGKTTLLELIAGLITPTAGQIEAPPAASMAQRDQLLPWANALDNAALPLRLAGLSRTAARKRTESLFGEFGLAGFEDRLPSQLSGGMRQRVAFLRTIVADRPVLTLDEPFAALDAITRGQMQEWLATLLRDAHRTTFLATHDIEEALLLADRIVVLSARPGTVVLDQQISLDDTRSRLDPALLELRETVMETLQ